MAQNNYNRRTLLKKFGGALAVGAIGLPQLGKAGEPAEKFYKAKNNRINQSVVNWCFKMPVEELANHAAKMGLKSVELVGPEHWPMLKKLGCTYVAVGHSERREYNGETDDVVNAKTKAALRNELIPIVCMGEGLPIRQAGEQVPYVLAQLDADLDGLTGEQVAGLVIAYEPVWAIGTGEVATPEDAQEVCGAIRSRVVETFGAEVGAAVRILYGGSVKSSNVAGIMAKPDVDGALIGGASLDPHEFIGIVRFRLHPPELVS